MKKILVITTEESIARGLKQSLRDGQYLFYWKKDIESAQILFSGSEEISAVFLDASSLGRDPEASISELCSLVRQVPVFVLVDELTAPLESGALMAGAAHVLDKPLDGNLVAELLGRYEGRGNMNENMLISPSRKDLRQTLVRDQENRMLQIARSFIEVPRFAGSSKAACQKTLTLLREMTGFRRVVLYFLRRKNMESPAAWQLELSYGVGRESLDSLDLNTRSGLGACMIDTGQILQFDSLAVESDPEIRKVFSGLRLDAVIPVTADNTLLGMVMVGGRITGEPLNRQELLLFYYLLENLGLYLKRPNPAPSNGGGNAIQSTEPEVRTVTVPAPADPVTELLKSSYASMPTAFMLVDSGGSILSANEAAGSMFSIKPDGDSKAVDVLPSVLAERIEKVLTSSDDGNPLIVRKEDGSNSVLRSRIFRVRDGMHEGKSVAGVVVEEVKAPVKAADKVQTESSVSPKTVVAVTPSVPTDSTGDGDVSDADPATSRKMYDKLARQIHYSLVPLSTHAQLLDQGHFDDDFQDSLCEVMHNSIHRFQRFSRQLSYMVRQQFDFSERVDWKKIVEGAFDEASDSFEDPRATFELLEEAPPTYLRCEEVAIKFALAEVFLNALQANTGKPQFLVKVSKKMAPNEPKGIEIIVRDMGDGFEPAALENAFKPFYSTRPAGLGLGLTVARRIIEGHMGTITVRPTPAQNQHEVAILLPIA